MTLCCLFEQCTHFVVILINNNLFALATPLKQFANVAALYFLVNPTEEFQTALDLK